MSQTYSNFFANIIFYKNLFYYRYFNPYAINHYNIINKLIMYKSSIELHEQIKKSLICDIHTICQSEKKFEICTEKFQLFYIKYNYHIEQNIDAMIECVKKDIIINDISPIIK